MTITDPLNIEQADLEALKLRYVQAGQGHIFAFWDELSQEQRSELFTQLSDMDIGRVNQIYKKTMSGTANVEHSKLAPLPDDVFDSVQTASPESIRAWNEAGLKLISQGKIAVILMAGGQGTRLGSSAPKGCYDINLPSHKSLFQLQAERILRLQNIAKEAYGQQSKCIIPWYIMTSGPTHEPSYQFFKANNFFGLKKENVTFFQQGMLMHRLLVMELNTLKCCSCDYRHLALLDYGRQGSNGDKTQGKDDRHLLNVSSLMLKLICSPSYGPEGCYCSRWQRRNLPGIA